MTEVTLATASEKQVWINTYFAEYVRASRFQPYISNADLNKGGVILSRYELQEEAGKIINIPFIGRLKGSGVTGAQVLDGAEEELTNHNCAIAVDWRRNGVRVPKSTGFRTEINLLNAAKDALQGWEAEKLRDDIIRAFAAAAVGGDATVDFHLAGAAQRDAWLAANADRVLFGAARSNFNAVFATAAAALDTGADRAGVAAIGLGKRMAKAADPHIRPFRTEDGREYFVAFHGARTFRDLKADPVMVGANTQARAREGEGMDRNPIFQDGDLLYDGVIHREVPEIDDYCAIAGLDGIGAAGADVRPVFLSGAGAVAIAWGQEPTPRADFVKDYGFRPGVAIEELLGVKKIAFDGKQNGVVTCFFAAAADS